MRWLLNTNPVFLLNVRGGIKLITDLKAQQ